ncbi:MAG: hypothetical protein JO095_04645, partial [Alphaproteobacteria bacterium]|nr:hypothetical protein [Alphaproteobacteria bacterium]
MSVFSRLIRAASVLVAAGMAMLAVSAATASAATCLCFHVLYTGGTDGHVHDSAYNAITKTWSDQVVPASVTAGPNPSGAQSADAAFHVVYVSRTGDLHDDRESPATLTWTDLIPPGSVKAAGTPTVLSMAPLSGSDFTLHIVYLGRDGWIHNDQFDPATKSWFDQIPPHSVPAASIPVAEDAAEGLRFFRVIYVGKDHHIHQDRFN